jgi:RNA polymerase sigma-70 factor (ECF subfamily)
MFVEALMFVAKGPTSPEGVPRPLLPAPSPSPNSKAPPQASASGTLPDFRAVYDAHFDFVWRFAANRGVPQAALDDVVQEVFVVVSRQLGTFQGNSALRTWIAGITRNVVRGYRRKRSNAATGDPLEGDDAYASELPTPVEALEHKSAGQLLDSILARMTELQREAFILCEIEGMSAVEVAEALNANENTVRTRLHDARKVFDAVSARLTAQRSWATRSGRSGA